IAESEKRPSFGGTSLARATLILVARSDPKKRSALASSAGLRVVATRSVGLPATSATSSCAAGPSSLVQLASAGAPTADAKVHNATRRDRRRCTGLHMGNANWIDG